jgi:hypothetical protein
MLLKLFRWYPLIYGCGMMLICTEILITLDSYYGYYPPSFTIGRNALLGVLIGSSAMLWRGDRTRGWTKHMLLMVLALSLFCTTGCNLLAFFSHKSFDWVDVLESSAIALGLSLVLALMGRWFLKEEYKYVFERSYHFEEALHISETLGPFGRVLASFFLILSCLGVIGAGYSPDPPRAKNVVVTLVPQAMTWGPDIVLSLPVHSLSQSETQPIESTPDEVRPNRLPGVLQIRSMEQNIQSDLHLQETQKHLGVIDNSLQCLTAVRLGIITMTCQEFVYDAAAARAAAVGSFKNTALPASLAHYYGVGELKILIYAAELLSNGRGEIFIEAWKTFFYTFSSSQLVSMANHLAGLSEEEADAFLAHQPGLLKAWLSTPDFSLPTDPAHIHFQVLLQL